mmetsp:Transcript_33391/g.78002  ORF Transcript_33391/g.78002 Transcript_33391/m.78002 type:complete len:368 (-) Transcript_33391:193-1296(-)
MRVIPPQLPTLLAPRLGVAVEVEDSAAALSGGRALLLGVCRVVPARRQRCVPYAELDACGGLDAHGGREGLGRERGERADARQTGDPRHVHQQPLHGLAGDEKPREEDRPEDEASWDEVLEGADGLLALLAQQRVVLVLLLELTPREKLPVDIHPVVEIVPQPVLPLPEVVASFRACEPPLRLDEGFAAARERVGRGRARPSCLTWVLIHPLESICDSEDRRPRLHPQRLLGLDPQGGRVPEELVSRLERHCLLPLAHNHPALELFGLVGCLESVHELEHVPLHARHRSLLVHVLAHCLDVGDEGERHPGKVVHLARGVGAERDTLCYGLRGVPRMQQLNAAGHFREHDLAPALDRLEYDRVVSPLG